ncbi:MAG: SsrA-binding protein SmpB [Succinivibrio sp.]|nr:SsrA-binding protein SmpB [Succinivibrio sp.]MCI5577208.1 SsrA-binding protein SmpB [Succinivibrio sp.]MCI5637823.1 SsrA-binding protein SmpB [Succinivibrio sp.]MCI6449298.1 SsrA-binding protein SmpB [Succinivibrio sp.]MCI7773698.1 SsrA-binding protein SmpB [Succinivibrio sp.]
MKVAKKEKQLSNVIAVNRKANFEYFIEDRYEAGLSLQGWEVKALRAGKANISEGYVTIKGGEIILLGSIINPLKTSCAFVVSDPTRTRKLLLSRKEIDKLTGVVQRQGYTLIPLKLYWKGSWAKLEVGVARGKQDHDKRDSIKDRQWARDKERIMKKSFK